MRTPSPPIPTRPDLPNGEHPLRRSTPTLPAGSGLPPMHLSEAAAAAPAAASAIGALLSGHVLRDGELVILILRPSRWFILLSSLKSLAVLAILMVLSGLFESNLPHPVRQFIMVGALLMAARLMVALVQWMSRLYILTDMRVLRLSGIFSVDIFDCPLRKVARTFLEATFKEKLFRIASITIIPQDENQPVGTWQMVPRPKEVYKQLLAAISRAKGTH